MGSEIGLYECPSCKKPLSFRHSDTTFIVCPSCHLSVQRLEGDVLVEKPVLVLTFRNESIKIGTTGIWQDKEFEVIGRIRFWFEESVFNYWTILFRNNTISYLAEGYGIYAMYEQLQLQKVVTLTQLSSMGYETAGKQLIDDRKFLMERKYTSDKFEIEGEVLLPAIKTPFKVFELAASDGTHIEFISFASGLLRCYNVRYTDYNSLALNNISTGSYKIKEIACSVCNDTINVKTYPYALSCVCENCGNRIDLRNVRNTGKNKGDCPNPYIKPGASGRIKGIHYTVVGYTLKEEENKYASRWVEFVLHNREFGYAFISEYDGNFIFVKENCQSPSVSNSRVSQFEYAGEPFHLFNRYNFKIINAQGEFPNNIFNDGALNVSEYISPPEMWILEKSNVEGKSWFFAEHLDRNSIPASFSENLPPKGTVGAIEPKGFVNPRKIILTTVVAILLVILIHLIVSFTASERVIIDSGYTFPDSVNPYSFVTEKFTLEKSKSNLEIEIVAPVNNSWFELSGTLVNAENGTEYSFEQGVEYYEGYDSGERWSEGGRKEQVYLSSIPAGTYFMQLQALKEPYRTLESFNVTVKNDVPMGRNLVLILLLLLIWPVIKLLRVHYTERERWYDSPFTPYTYEN